MAASAWRAVSEPRLGHRWTVVALLFGTTTVNYVDRQVLGILAPTLTRELHWTETDYAAIVSWFSVAYGLGLLVMGRVMDRIGVRAVVAALLVPPIALGLGWRWAFVATGALDLIWLTLWVALYRDPARPPREDTTSWGSLIGRRQTWAFIVGKALTDPVWLFYLFWLPKFLDASFGVRLAGLAAPLVVIYV